ncbi:MAG: T9SS type A sorting domain-containing protein [Chitinophagaceae bacterium]|nr:T9SS type A sorting domain-containing protein [Chitinophagaceae bacterium]
MKNINLPNVLSFLIAALLLISSSAADAQNCIPPLKQVVLYDQSGNFYVYWKPATTGTSVNYKVQVKCVDLPACFYTVTVTNANVLHMNGGYLGVKIPALPMLSSTVKLSIFAPNCPDQFTLAFVLTLDIITDNLDIAIASCDSDTCKLVVSKWTKLKNLSDYATSKCGGGAAVAASTVSAIDAPIDILLRKTAAGKWQMKSLDTLNCDSCYVFNFQISCPSGSIYYVQDTICFNYTGPDIGCRESGILAALNPLTIYPNPATDYCTIRIDLKEAADVSVALYNSIGQQLNMEDLAGSLDEGMNELEFSVADLSPGLYIVELRINNDVKRLKLLKF